MATLSEILALFPDNNQGLIDASDMRDAITALWQRTDGTAAVEGIQLDTTSAAPPQQPGLIHWNPTSAGAEIDSVISGVSLQVGYEQWINARNMSGSVIPNGTPVQIVGVTGDRPRIAIDDGQGNIAGVATHDIADNADGRVTAFGLVRNLNTTAFNEGDLLYVSPAGALTTALTASFVGIVTKDHANEGHILARPASLTNPAGLTAERPASPPTGFMFFDTTLGQPIWFNNGSGWVDATGTSV